MARARRRTNPPGTAETPENASGGVLFVLFPGFGPEAPEGGEPMNLRARGLITSSRIDRGEPVRRALDWLSRAGFPVEREASAFSIAVWPDAWSRPVRGVEQVRALCDASESFLAELERRRPKLVVCLSCYLFDALNAPVLAERVEAALGAVLEPSRRLTHTRLRAEARRRSRALVLGLPIPGPNTTPAFEAELTEALVELFQNLVIFDDRESVEPLNDCCASVLAARGKVWG